MQESKPCTSIPPKPLCLKSSQRNLSQSCIQFYAALEFRLHDTCDHRIMYTALELKCIPCAGNWWDCLSSLRFLLLVFSPWWHLHYIQSKHYLYDMWFSHDTIWRYQFRSGLIWFHITFPLFCNDSNTSCQWSWLHSQEKIKLRLKKTLKRKKRIKRLPKLCSRRGMVSGVKTRPPITKNSGKQSTPWATGTAGLSVRNLYVISICSPSRRIFNVTSSPVK